MLELKFLGRGSAFNVKEGNTSAYIKQDDMLLLIDCGESIFQKIVEKKLLDDVKEVNILITHLHSDHCGSLSSLIMYCYYCKGIKPNIYHPDIEDIKNFLNSTGACYSNLWNYMDRKMLNNDYNLNITPLIMSHVNELNSYGYHVVDEISKQNVIYSGDTNSIDSFFVSFECYRWKNTISYHDTCLADYDGNVHTSLRRLCELVPKEYRNKVYCMHLDCDELIEKAKLEGFNVVEVE
jgi:ribonuclease BN (tRNA processing enzyme)